MKKKYVLRNPKNGKYFTNNSDQSLWDEYIGNAYKYDGDCDMDNIINCISNVPWMDENGFEDVDCVELVTIWLRN